MKIIAWLSMLAVVLAACSLPPRPDRQANKPDAHGYTRGSVRPPTTFSGDPLSEPDADPSILRQDPGGFSVMSERPKSQIQHTSGKLKSLIPD